MRALAIPLLVLSIGATRLLAQGGVTLHLTLQDAEAMALKNHPRVLAAQDVTSAANQRVTEARSAYYPTFQGDITGSQANPRARIGAGYLTTSSLFNRVGAGFTLSQLISDWGRTSNLV